MRTAIVFSNDQKVGFAAGLVWVSLPGHKGGNRVSNDVRENVKRAMADKIVIHSVDSGEGVATSLGMYAQDDRSPDVKAKNLHSLAAAFVLAFPGNLHQILAWRIDDERGFCIIVIQDGLPVADAIKSEVDAKKLMNDALAGKMGAKGHVVHSNDPTFHKDCTVVTEAAFYAAANKATKLKGIPIRPAVLVVTFAILAFMAGGAFSGYQAHKKKERMIAAAKLAADDPVPTYQALLASRIQRMGLNRKSLIETLDSIGNAEVWSQGWLLSQIECSAGQCISSWEREGGTTEALLGANRGDELLSDSTSEKVRLRRNVPLLDGGLQSQFDAVPGPVAIRQYVNTYQVWRNAKLVVTESEDPTEFKTWPPPLGGDLSRLPPEITVKARPFEVSVPYVLVKELIDGTPEAVWYESFVLKYTPSDSEKRLEVILKGKTYVK